MTIAYAPLSEYHERIKSQPKALTTYLAAVGHYMNGDVDEALRHVEWLDEAFGLDGFPDVIMLGASLRQQLPLSDHRHRDPTTDELRQLYETRSQLGIMRRTLIQFSTSSTSRSSLVTVGSIPMKLWTLFRPDIDVPVRTREGQYDASTVMPLAEAYFSPVMCAVRWPEFEVSLPVLGERSALGAWALNRVLAGDYDTAKNVLDEAGTFDNPGLWIAQMALYYDTSRWTDLRDVANRARSLSPDQLASGSIGSDIDQHAEAMVHDLACLFTALADASLGQTMLAHSNFDTARHSDNRAVAARAAYVQGLTHRPQNESQAAELIQNAWRTHNDARYEVALRDTEVRLRTTTDYLIADRTDPWDVTTEPDPEMERLRDQKALRDSYRIRAEELMNLQVGMEDVKEEVNKLIRSIRVTQERIRRGADQTSANYNLIFTGPPGTGKSTIVNVLALHMAALGIIEDPEPMVTHRENFVADTVGGTAIRSKDTIASAEGKLLFIDEAYALVQQDSGPNLDAFGKEALDTIVAESELRIGKVVFVMAGYSADIERLVRVNDGLNSRFPRRVDFRPYTLAELSEIARLQAQKSNLMLAEDAADFLADDDGPARKVLVSNDRGEMLLNVLGNGRFARNLVESAAEYMSVRITDEYDDLTEASHDDLHTLTLGDITQAFDQHVSSALKR